MKVIFACAGTGGHVNPAIAIANTIMQKEPDSCLLFIGTKTGLENTLVKKAGYDIAHISTGKIIRSFTFKNITALVKTYKGIGEARQIVKEFAPDIVIGTGGYICGPVMLAARKLKIPYVLHESNAFPGVAVKLLAKHASKMLIGFEDAKNRLKYKNNILYTGNPTKFTQQGIQQLKVATCKQELGLQAITKKIVLVMCGSQGARKINQVVLDMVAKYKSKDFYVILATGDKNYSEVLKRKQELEQQVGQKLDDYLKIEKYIYEMDKMYKVASMCITRAGAMTVTELSIAAKPAILIPLPSAAENHQLYNAKVLEKAGAGKVMEEKDLNEDTLFENIQDMIPEATLEKMGQQAGTLVVREVEEKIYQCIKDIVK